MKIILFMIVLILVFFFILTRKKDRHRREDKPQKRSRYDCRGFDHNHIHENGTKYDDAGFDFYGYDTEGFNRRGYNKSGRNRAGKYDRFYDATACHEEGFYSYIDYPIFVTPHARERISERLGIDDPHKANQLVNDAYRYGRSKRQIKKTSAYLVDEIERKHNGGIVLIYRNYVYVFSCENTLITVYKNERISL